MKLLINFSRNLVKNMRKMILSGHIALVLALAKKIIILLLLTQLLQLKNNLKNPKTKLFSQILSYHWKMNKENSKIEYVYICQLRRQVQNQLFLTS